MWALAAAIGALLSGLVAIGWFFDKRRLPSTTADAALVFGTGLGWKAASRLAVAVWLHDRGLVRHFIVSGGVPMHDQPATTEAEWLREQLVAHGVPAERVHLENRATNTAENVGFALPIIEAHGFRRIVLVMSDFEGIRAHLTARRAWRGHGLEIYDVHARSTGHWNRWGWWLTREGRRLTWYTLPRLFRYGLLPYLWRSSK